MFFQIKNHDTMIKWFRCDPSSLLLIFVILVLQVNEVKGMMYLIDHINN